MKLAKIKKTKSVLGGLWYMMFEAKWVYKWILVTGYAGTIAVLSFLIYKFIQYDNIPLTILFTILLAFICNSAWKIYKLEKYKMNDETLGEVIKKYD